MEEFINNKWGKENILLLISFLVGFGLIYLVFFAAYFLINKNYFAIGFFILSNFLLLLTLKLEKLLFLGKKVYFPIYLFIVSSLSILFFMSYYSIIEKAPFISMILFLTIFIFPIKAILVYNFSLKKIEEEDFKKSLFIINLIISFLVILFVVLDFVIK